MTQTLALLSLGLRQGWCYRVRVGVWAGVRACVRNENVELTQNLTLTLTLTPTLTLSLSLNLFFTQIKVIMPIMVVVRVKRSVVRVPFLT